MSRPNSKTSTFNTLRSRKPRVPPQNRASDSVLPGQFNRRSSVNSASPFNEPLDDIELLSISQASRCDDSGVQSIPINIVQSGLQAMVELQRINRHEEQGNSDISDPTIAEAYMATGSSRLNNQNRGNSVSPTGSKLPIDIRKLNDSELRALIADAAKELKNREIDTSNSNLNNNNVSNGSGNSNNTSEAMSKSRRPRSKSSSKIVSINSWKPQEWSSRDYHNYEIDDPEVRSYSSRDEVVRLQTLRSGAVPPMRFSDTSNPDDSLYTFTPVNPPTPTALPNTKKKPKLVQPSKQKVPNLVISLPRSPSLDLVMSPRSAFDDCSVGSSLSESTSNTGGWMRYTRSFDNIYS